MKLKLPAKYLAALSCAASLMLVACGDDAPGNKSSQANTSAAEAPAPGKVSDANLDAEIARLESTRQPNDVAVSEHLAKLYVRRGNIRKAAHDLPGALNDYRSALRYDPDNEEAIENAAALTPEETGEYGEPVLPISPNVTSGGEEPAPTQQPTNRR